MLEVGLMAGAAGNEAEEVVRTELAVQHETR